MVVVQPNAVGQIACPESWTNVNPADYFQRTFADLFALQLCANTDPNSFGPARRSPSPSIQSSKTSAFQRLREVKGNVKRRGAREV